MADASSKRLDQAEITHILETLGIKPVNYGATSGSSKGWVETSGPELTSFSPIDGRSIAKILQADRNAYETVMDRAEKAFQTFRMMPAPKRGEIIRDIGNALREKKEAGCFGFP